VARKESEPLVGRVLEQAADRAKAGLKHVLPNPAIEALRALRRAPNSLVVANLKRRHQRLNAETELDSLRLRDGLEIHVEPVARHGFEAYCWWWPEMVHELDRFLAISRSKTTLIDVGALHGLFTLAFVAGRSGVKAIAVEPEAAACDVIDAHIRSNGIPNVRLAKVAVGAHAGSIPMELRGQHLEAVSDAELHASPGQVVAIPATTVDMLCTDLDAHPDLIKIDVEGYELEVLKGAYRVLRDDRPEVMLELHPQQIAQLGGSVAELVTYLDELGYRFRDLRGRLIQPSRLREREQWGHFICSPVDDTRSAAS
jgi:FkbM family methyltransferase